MKNFCVLRSQNRTYTEWDQTLNGEKVLRDHHPCLYSSIIIFSLRPTFTRTLMNPQERRHGQDLSSLYGKRGPCSEEAPVVNHLVPLYFHMFVNLYTYNYKDIYW